MSAHEQQARWDAFGDWLRYCFAEPDIEGFNIALAVALSHYYDDDEPVWLTPFGASGGGKTDMIINILAVLDGAKVVGALTAASLLPGVPTKRNRDTSLLNEPRSIWLVKDLGTIASMQAYKRRELLGRLREVWDGQLVVNSALTGRREWEGKVTIIGCGTPRLESFIAAESTLGERFMTLRWRSAADSGTMQEKAWDNRDQHKSNRLISQRLLLDLAEGRARTAMPDKRLLRKHVGLFVDLLTHLRQRTERENSSQRPIIDVSERERPTRIANAVGQIIRANMDLFHRSAPSLEDFRLAHRILFDSIPSAYREVLRYLPPKTMVSFSDIVKQARLPRAMIYRALDDLEEIDAIRVNETVRNQHKTAILSDTLANELAQAKIRLHGREASGVLPFEPKA